MSESSEPRRRNAVATREALLEATRALLALHAGAVTTRDIAARVGVNQALINRYFGSKEKLFVEAVRPGLSEVVEVVATEPLAEVPERVLGVVLAAGGSGSGVAGLLGGPVDSDTVREIVRSSVENVFTETLGARLGGPDAGLRAELINALVAGIAMMRHRIGSPALADADVDEIAHYVRLMAAPLLEAQSGHDARPTAASTRGESAT